MENQYIRIENELHQLYETLQAKKNKLRRNNTNKGVREDEENRKADHRILKALIEYYQGHEEQINKDKLNLWSSEVEKLQKIQFRFEVEFDKLGQFLKEACYGLQTF